MIVDKLKNPLKRLSGQVELTKCTTYLDVFDYLLEVFVKAGILIIFNEVKMALKFWKIKMLWLLAQIG